MLRALVKKDITQLLQDRTELLVLFVMPLVLIAILGFSLGSQSGSVEGLDIPIAVVDQGSREESLNDLRLHLADKGISESEQVGILAAAEQFSIADNLVEQLQGGFDGIFVVTLEDLVQEAILSEEYAAVIELPGTYRLELWNNVFFSDETMPANLRLLLNEDRSFEAAVVEQVIETYVSQMQVNTVFAHQYQEHGQPINETMFEPVNLTVENIGLKTVTSFDYYAIGMSVMFVLFVASFIGNYAFVERESHVFQRLLLANLSPSLYVFSKWMSGTFIAFIQLTFLFVSSFFLFDVSWGNGLTFLFISFLLSLTIGAFATMITVLNLNMNEPKASSVFATIIVTILAFLGGSFISLQGIDGVISTLGDWTPNGAAMQSYFLAQQGATITDIFSTIYPLFLISSCFLILSIILFPKRGEAK